MSSYSLRRLCWAGPLATTAAVLVVMAYFAVTKTLGEQYLMPLQSSSSIPGPMPVILPVVATLVSGLVASLLFGILVHFAQKPATVFLSVCVAALLLSFGGPFNLPLGSLQTKLLLSGMHVIVAAVISGGIIMLSQTRSR